ncbi:MAG: 2-amino-4-hydroxy-6-hydroxymethyldihydropteridine diphosphokinase [Planctomycetota bacterium]
MATAYLGLGSNLGDRAAALLTAVSHLTQTPGIELRQLSSIYESAAVDSPADAGSFYNMVIEVETSQSPRELLRTCLSIEDRMGRFRPAGIANAARVIDIDVVAIGDEVIAEPDLLVPHRLMHERHFVLAPLVEIAPDWRHPELRQTSTELLLAAESSPQIVRASPILEEAPETS